MAEAREWLVQWLRDAHVREEQAEATLSAPAERIDTSSELEQRTRQPMAGTKIRADRLRAFLEPPAGR